MQIASQHAVPDCATCGVRMDFDRFPGRALRLRIPVAEEYLPLRDDALGQAACAALDELRVPLRALLKRPVDEIYLNTGDGR